VWEPRNAAERKAADDAVRFIGHLTHTRGRWAGSHFDLLAWQKEIIRPLFGVLKPDGTRQHRTAYVEIPRKAGKSELAAAVALRLLFADNEAGAQIYGAAADRDQASLVFDVAAQMVRNSPILRQRAKIIDYSKRIIVTKGVSAGSFYRAIPADAAGSHGFDASGVVFDELHTQPNRELWDVLVTSTGARTQPLIFGITTAGYDRLSLCWELHEYSRQVIEGIVEDPSWLSVIYGASEGADWADPAVWRAANPSFGITVTEDYYAQQAKQAKQTPTFENTFRRLLLNQWTSNETRWMPMHEWDACAAPVDMAQLEGRHCYAGLDLSSTTDLTALSLIFPSDDPSSGPFKVLMRYFVPEQNLVERGRRDRVPYETWARQGLIEATEGNVVDYGTVEREIRKLSLRYQLLRLAVDRGFNAEYLSQRLRDAGIEVVNFGQGFLHMSYPTKELLRLVLQRRLAHGGHPVLRWNVDGTMVEHDSNGNIRPSKARSTQRIDGAVALVMGLDLALRSEGPSVYETQGIFSV
jgi:phage terminase large subunit-like protein